MRTLTRTSLRQRLALLVGAAVAAQATLLLAAPAQADDAATLTIVGTSDVYDSFLVQTVLKPEFEKAYPQYTLNYVSRGTGAAIAYAKSGAASALIVHAASLENQFVAEGYSLESYGRAIFWGDFILGGFTSDPAGATAKGHTNDIVRTFEDIASAGAGGTATFVSRGGTPGTTVQEHAIWALTTGVPLCDISTADGGGKAPTANSGSACGTVADLPAWYKRTDQTQAPNILTANTCNFSPRPAESCYVFTDRGTFNYLESTSQVGNLRVITRDNAPTAVGGPDLLVNSFHAYAINPAKFAGTPAVSINTLAATAFLNWVTSPPAQAAVGGYLNGTGDAPFLPSAAPAVTQSTLPASIAEGASITVTGSIKNVVPGTPNLDFVPVKLVGTPAGGAAATVATTTTNAAGAFTLTYKPTGTMTYSLVTDQITKIQNAALNPVFGDLLAPTATPLGSVQFVAASTQPTPTPELKTGKVTVTTKFFGNKVKFFGGLRPKAGSTQAFVKVFVKRAGTKKFKSVKKVKLKKGAKKWSTRLRLTAGVKYYVKYVNPGTSTPATTAKKKLKR